MHRSGTSCLTGTLQEAGLHLGEVVLWAGHNAKGNRENPLIMQLHDDILTDNGGNWDAPPEQVIWSAEHKARRDAILAAYGDAPLWGFKDPRTLFTLDGWLEVLPDVRFVASFRHPANVVRSLQLRNGGKRDRWIRLWIRYNKRLLELHERFGFPIACFDLPEPLYRRSLIPIIEWVGLKPPPDLSFFDPELRHHVEVTEPVPERAQPIYDRLRQIAFGS